MHIFQYLEDFLINILIQFFKNSNIVKINTLIYNYLIKKMKFLNLNKNQRRR